MRVKILQFEEKHRFGVMLMSFALLTSPALRLPAPAAAPVIMQLRSAAERAAARGNGWGPSYPSQSANVVQGGARRTWSKRSQYPGESEVFMNTDGRPLEANIELWQGPGYTPRKMRVYSDDGYLRPFRSLETPHSSNGHSYSIRNRGPLEFPMAASVRQLSGYGGPHRGGYGSVSPSGYPGVGAIQQSGGIPSVTVQGGAIRSFPFGPEVESVEVILSTEGRNLQARIELLQGPDNVKQSIDLEEDDGYNRPFVCTFETPGYGHVVRIVNNGPIEFPLTASVIPRTFARPGYDDRVVLGGRIGGYGYGGDRGGQSGLGGMGRGRTSLHGYDDQRWYDPVGAGAMSYGDRGGGYGGYDERRGGYDNGRPLYQDTREYAMSYGGRGQAVDSRPWWERA
jgi:hypothetical protein